MLSILYIKSLNLILRSISVTHPIWCSPPILCVQLHCTCTILVSKCMYMYIVHVHVGPK